jgi:hypothetical protein
VEAILDEVFLEKKPTTSFLQLLSQVSMAVLCVISGVVTALVVWPEEKQVRRAFIVLDKNILLLKTEIRKTASSSSSSSFMLRNAKLSQH